MPGWNLAVKKNRGWGEQGGEAGSLCLGQGWCSRDQLGNGGVGRGGHRFTPRWARTSATALVGIRQSDSGPPGRTPGSLPALSQRRTVMGEQRTNSANSVTVRNDSGTTAPFGLEPISPAWRRARRVSHFPPPQWGAYRSGPRRSDERITDDGETCRW